MNTAILRIAAPAAGAQDYDITLMLRDEAGQEQPLAATTCPVTLQPPGMAGALSAAALVDRFAAAQGQDEVIRTIGVQLHALIAGVGAALAALPSSRCRYPRPFDPVPASTAACRKAPGESLVGDP